MDKSKEGLTQLRDAFREAADILDELLEQINASAPDEKDVEGIMARFLIAMFKLRELSN